MSVVPDSGRACGLTTQARPVGHSGISQVASLPAYVVTTPHGQASADRDLAVLPSAVSWGVGGT